MDDQPANVNVTAQTSIEKSLQKTFASSDQPVTGGNRPRAAAAEPKGQPLHPPASRPTLPRCTGDANWTATRRKSMSRRVIVSAGNTEPEIRQRGHVYQKGRRQSDPWVPTLR